MNKTLRRILASDRSNSLLSSAMAVVVGLIVGLIVLLVSNPAQAMGGFMTLLTSGVSNPRSMGEVIYFATPIIMTGLSVGFALRTGLFNIGASGQFVAGAYAAIYVGVKFTFLPGPLHWLTALLAAMLAGAIVASIPGILKALCNVHEVIACIMMNYISMYMVNWLIPATGVYNPLTNQSMRVAPSAHLPKGGLDLIFREGNRISGANSGIFIAIIVAIIVYIILEKTAFGYELKACGFNRNAAKYAGVNEKRSIVLSMLLAGAMAGLGGSLLYLSGTGNMLDVVDVLATEGFNGIPVALLGLNHPLGIIISGMFVAYLTVGGFNMQLFGFAPQAIEIIIAVIIYFSAFALFLKGIMQNLAKRGADITENANAEDENSEEIKPEPAVTEDTEEIKPEPAAEAESSEGGDGQ